MRYGHRLDYYAMNPRRSIFSLRRLALACVTITCLAALIAWPISYNGPHAKHVHIEPVCKLFHGPAPCKDFANRYDLFAAQQDGLIKVGLVAAAVHWPDEPTIVEPIAVRGQPRSTSIMTELLSTHLGKAYRTRTGAKLPFGWVQMGDWKDFAVLQRAVILPHWLVIALTAPWPIIALRDRRRRASRAKRNECTECGYSLEGNESGTCPECGTERA